MGAPGVRVITGPSSLRRRAAACSGGRLEVLDGIFSTGWADCLASWGGGMPRYFQQRFQGGGAAVSRAFGWSRGLLSGPLSGPPEGLVCPSARALPPVLPRGRRAALRAVRKAGPEGGFFAPFARLFPVRRGAWEAPDGAVFRRTAENGPVQEKCEGVSSYGLWGLRAWICAMNVRSERMSVSARFSDTAQLGRVCKKSVRRDSGGVQGGSLSKKLRLN